MDGRPDPRPRHPIAIYPAEAILPLTAEGGRREFVVDGKPYRVWIHARPYRAYRADRRCAACGLLAEVMILERDPDSRRPVFRLYAEADGRLIPMTTDHIIPRARGGRDVPENFQTMCAPCNTLKADSPLTAAQVNQLRQVREAAADLPKKERRRRLRAARQGLQGLEAEGAIAAGLASRIDGRPHEPAG